MNVEELLGTKDVAKALGVSQSLLYVWKGRGMGPRPYKVGSAVVYRAEDVEEYRRARVLVGLDKRQ